MTLQKSSCLYQIGRLEARVLSKAGKMVFVRSNFSGIHLYTMSGTKIPNYIAHDLDNANRKFFWDNNLDSNQSQPKISLIAWDKICRLKSEGSLSIRRIKDGNAAMLTKLDWK